jgi:TetR/AcrR family transcriptional regulator, cholesterol catabolism regulator
MSTRAARSRDDVVRTAGKLFAERGYHGTSMRDLAAELGLLGSSLYSHISSKEDLLVEVVEKGAVLFQGSADAALATSGTAADRLRALVAGHVDVVLDHLDEVRTFLNEAGALDESHRNRVVAARDRYEASYRSVLSEMKVTDPKLGAIFLLSILNALERWYRPTGPVQRQELADEIIQFAVAGMRR